MMSPVRFPDFERHRMKRVVSQVLCVFTCGDTGQLLQAFPGPQLSRYRPRIRVLPSVAEGLVFATRPANPP